MKTFDGVLALAGFCALALTVACEKSVFDAEQRQSEISAASVGAPITIEAGRGTDDMLSFLAERLPGGFGGLYLDEDGKLVVLLKDPGEASNAFSVLLDLQRPLESRPPLTMTDLRVEQADFDFRELRQWRDAARDILSLDGVVSLDINERRNRVLVGISSAGVDPIHDENEAHDERPNTLHDRRCGVSDAGVFRRETTS